MNEKIKRLFENRDFARFVKRTATEQMRRRRLSYAAVSIFTATDLEQEIWAGLFESTMTKDCNPKDYVVQLAETIARCGCRKRCENVSETPVSQLNKRERKEAENIFYSN